MKKKYDQDTEQVRKFKTAARQLECDPSEEAFDAALKKIAKASLAKPEKKAKKPAK